MNLAFRTLLRSRVPARGLRGAADLVDLQLAHVVRTLRRFAPRLGGRLLDVGCGDKPYASTIRPYVREYVGVEHAASFAATASASRASADVTYDGRSLPFADATFDSVLCAQVLEHTPDPAGLIREIARVLRPGGALVLSAPFSFRLHEEPHDYFRFAPSGLAHLCRDAGLDIEELAPHGSLWSLVGHKLNTFVSLRVMRLGGVAQSLGKLGHEPRTTVRPRLWTLPVGVPAMFAIAACARGLDALAPEPTETLGFTILARRVDRTA